MGDCLFCQIDKGEIPAEKVYDGEEVYAIKDVNPQAPTHLLLIPKKHLSSLMDMEVTDERLFGAILNVGKHLAKKMNLESSGFRIVLNTGSGAGQSVFHVHFHLLAGRPMKWPPG
ncbi:MAG: histidine triad nucleotide-binding protein [Nitrospina sp.]|nr:MAG: histidine triad nucleotide-binding protein [Nitrospina sp.]